MFEDEPSPIYSKIEDQSVKISETNSRLHRYVKEKKKISAWRAVYNVGWRFEGQNLSFRNDSRMKYESKFHPLSFRMPLFCCLSWSTFPDKFTIASLLVRDGANQLFWPDSWDISTFLVLTWSPGSPELGICRVQRPAFRRSRQWSSKRWMHRIWSKVSGSSNARKSSHWDCCRLTPTKTTNSQPLTSSGISVQGQLSTLLDQLTPWKTDSVALRSGFAPPSLTCSSLSVDA